MFMSAYPKKISLRGVKVHNLQSLSIELQTGELIVFSGVSGSGKSSLAFDTLYVEGQRRYVESLSTFARRQLQEMSRPELESAEGLSPTISIEQKTAGRNPRSTVGTMTEVYDYLRVLYARVGRPHCPVSGEPVSPQSRERIIRTLQSLPEGTRILLLAPYARGRKGEFREDFLDLLKKGFTRVRVDGHLVDLESGIQLEGQLAHDIDVVIDRLVIGPETSSRLAEAVTQALEIGAGLCSYVDVDSQEEQLFSMHAYSPTSGLSYAALEPHDFSFNSPSGMCSRCSGLGVVNEFDLNLVIDPELSIAQDCCQVASSYQTVRYRNIYDNLARLFGFKVETPWKELTESARKVFLYGTERKWTRMHFVHPVTGAKWVDNIRWKGVLGEAHDRYAEAKSDTYRKRAEKLMCIQVCPECQGERLKPYPAATLLQGRRIASITQMTISAALHFFETLELPAQERLIAGELLKEIIRRLRFLEEVGLHYLTLDRTAPTLSGGEAQRVRLASQIGSGLVGITYVLDEPSIGLHPRDNAKLIQTLKHLRDQGNTVVVVEHDEEMIWEADTLVDFGPGAGSQGGHIIAQGPPASLLENPVSLTMAYATGRKRILIPKKRRRIGKEKLLIKQAAHHNLKEIDVAIPLHLLVAVTGVSGSGKSSLITEILYPALANALHRAEHSVGKHQSLIGIDQVNKVIAIDQSPIGRNPRSNPATYIKLFDEIRELFSQLPESQAKGYSPGRFSFNVKEGSCPHCAGMGMLRIDMDFLEDAWVECDLCQGERFDAETLSIRYKGKTIADILNMDVSTALEFFQAIPAIKQKLETLKRVGLDYLQIGQPSTTLSGGEAQRVKLAKELVRPATGRTFYILDEPTTGLHFADIAKLLEVLQELVDRGNSVLVIEHNMDVVKTADWILDLGPEGGEGGGCLVAAGKPEAIAKMETPTGLALKEALYPNYPKRMEQAIERWNALKQRTHARNLEDRTLITVCDAEQNNLKRITATVPRNQITVCTGPSGSGKSSFAFETLYAEGQRRYAESLSPYARQFVKQMPKPKVGQVTGLSPAIAIEQKAHAGNPRSTVGTMTEIYDYLRLLYARMGDPHCPETGEPIRSISKEFVAQRILEYPEGEKIQILAPITLRKQENFLEAIERLQRQGYVRIRLNGALFDLDSDLKQIPFDRKKKNELQLVIDRLKVQTDMGARLREAIEQAASIGDKRLVVLREDGQEQLFNLTFAVESTGKSYPPITPHIFSFNSSEGMCLDCQGLGIQYGAHLAQRREIIDLSVLDLMQQLWQDKASSAAFALLHTVLKEEGIESTLPLHSLPAKKLQLLMQGSPPDRWYASPEGWSFRWPGIDTVFARAGRMGRTELKEAILPLLDEHECPSCQGGRLNPLAQAVTLQGLTLKALCYLPIDQALAFVESIALPSDEKVLEEVQQQLLQRLRFLQEVGLGYLALERRAPTLSGGEAQRIRLARQLGSGLTGLLYVLDEPTIGLHPCDNDRLNQALKRLKELGNTLVLVEHDPLTVATADHILDFGPQSGDHGGHLMAQGTYAQLLEDPNSLTGAYLSGRKCLPIPKKRRPLTSSLLKIKGVTIHNLNKLSLDLPLGIWTCLTGVSGSGKSTLMHQVLVPALTRALHLHDAISWAGGRVAGISQVDKLIVLDQNPIGGTSRSDVGTYVDLLSRLREFFVSLPAAKMRGLQPRHFSSNHRQGMCTACWGMGYKRVEMHFLPPIRVQCEECKGLRLNPLSLEVLYQNKNFGEYLQMTVDTARVAFQHHPRLVKLLDTLISVGLGYLKLGQEVASLSGGEAQRLRLSRELVKRSTGKTLYLLDEPTTGLHSDDLAKLLPIFQRLVDKGNSLLMIEHNMEMIKSADWVIEMGPGAGQKGGQVVFQGTPEALAKSSKAATAPYLS